MKVAIWGSYAYGNYGDELMALQFALYLKRLGAEPHVFCLNEELAKAYGLGSSATADELLKDAKFCVLGGGSLLSGDKKNPAWYEEMKAREYNELADALEKYECPLYFISIGGDGAFGDKLNITPYRDRLLRSRFCKMATVRLAEDVARVESTYGIKSFYYPDVLLSAPQFWNLGEVAKHEEPRRIGLSVQACRQSMKLVEVMSRFWKKVQFFSIGTVRPQDAHGITGENPSMSGNGSCFHRQEYYEPIQTLQFLRTLDVMVTHKLHIGVTALAFGVPYVCVGASLKCKAFLYSIGAAFAYWGDLPKWKQDLQIIKMTFSRRCREALERKYAALVLDEQKRQSWGHMERLKQIYEEHQRSSQ